MSTTTVSNPTLLALRGMTIEQKEVLAKDLGVHINTLYRWIKDNDENLTKMGVVRKISKATGLPIEVIIPIEL